MTSVDPLDPLGHDRHVERVRVTESVVELGTPPTLSFYADSADTRASP